MEAIEEYTYKGQNYYTYSYLESINHPCIRGSKRGIIKFLESKKLVQAKHYYFLHKETGKISNYIRGKVFVIFDQVWVDSFDVDPPLPPLLKLEDHEMFCDEYDNVYDVEVRGERHFKKCYFKASDIADCFEIPRLLDIVLRDCSSYEKGTDYMTFTAKNTNSGKCNETVYLTYHGLIRAIIVSRSGNAKHFHDWMMETLFTVHLGTAEQKTKAASKLLGIDYQTVLSFCSVLTSKVSGIYVMRLGTVKDLRDKLNIPDTHCPKDGVYKIGRSDDIKRRFKNHLDGKYSPKNGFDCTIACVWFVDKERCPAAEYALKKHLQENGWLLVNKKHTEIAIFDIPKKAIIEELDPLFSEYTCEIRNLNQRIADLEHANQILAKNNMIADKEKNIIEERIRTIKQENETLRRELRIKDLELELAKKLIH